MAYIDEHLSTADGFERAGETVLHGKTEGEGIVGAAMPVGECRLCLKSADLQDSHLLPRAFYGLLREPGSANPNPIVFTPDIYMKTSKQVSEYLLCSSCEGRFNERGEKWILNNCWRSETDFPFQAALNAATPIEQSASFRAFDGGAILSGNLAKLVYFPISVFWRSAAHQWKPILGQRPQKLDFGPFQEPIRQFLLDEGELPGDAVLLVTVNSMTQAGPNNLMLFPWRDAHDSYFHYTFVVPGITFQFFLGKGIPAHIRLICTARAPQHPIYMSKSKELQILRSSAGPLSAARPKGKLG